MDQGITSSLVGGGFALLVFFFGLAVTVPRVFTDYQQQWFWGAGAFALAWAAACLGYSMGINHVDCSSAKPQALSWLAYTAPMLIMITIGLATGLASVKRRSDLEEKK